MKRTTSAYLLLLLSFVLLTGCSPFSNHTSELPLDLTNIGDGKQEIAREDNKLIIWSDIPLGDEVIKGFEKENPGVQIEVHEKLMDTELKDYMQAMVDQQPVDVFIIDNTFLGKFSNLQGFENLLAAPYGAGKYEESVTGTNWNNFLTVKDDALFTLPVALSPEVLYYRADLMKKYGYPSEPEELASFMDSKENIFSLAEEMKTKGHSIFLWDTFFIDLYISKYGFLTENFNTAILKEDFIESIELTKEIKQKGYMVNKDIWKAEGQQAIRDGEIIMLPLGSWGEKYLPEFAPELSGVWKATRMPLGINGRTGSTSLSIPSHSDKKQLAWGFIEYTMEHGLEFQKWPLVPAYEPIRTEAWRRDQTNPYFGNQKTYALYEDLLGHADTYTTAPFEDELFSVLYTIYYDGIEKNVDPEEIYTNYTNTVAEKYREQIKFLRNK